MSFFYDLNKKLDSIRATPEVTHQQLNERDLGKHNNATTGFAALAKKTGGGEKGARIAGAQLAKMRAKGQVEEEFGPGTQGPKGNQAGPGPITPDTENYKTPNSDMVRDYYKKSGTDLAAQDWAAKKGAWDTDAEGQNRYVDRTAPGIMNTLKNKLGYDMPDPAYGPKPDEAQRLAKRHPAPMKEGGWNPVDEPVSKSSAANRSSSKKYDPNIPGSGIIVGPYPVPPPKKTDDNRLYKDSVPVDEPVKKTTNEGGVVDPVGEIRPGQRTPVRPSYKPEVKRITPLPKPSGAVDDDEIDESALQAAFGMKKYGEPGMKELQRLGRIGASEKTKAAARKKYNQYDESMTDEGNAFSGAVVRAKRDGIQPGEKIRVGGKEYPVQEQGMGMPARKKSFADNVASAKKEVDEMLGQVAADAMKKAIGSGRGRNAEMDEASDWSQLHKPFKAGHFDDTPTRRRSSSGGEIDTGTPGVTRHRPVKGNYSGAGHDAGAETSSDSSDGPRGRGRPKGSKAATGAKINRGTSKLMTREGDQDPADQGEYGREGEMGRNEIHTMMRNAKQLEKMLGNDDDLPEWVQKKLSLASDYMQTIADYLASEKETDAEDETGREVEVELAEKKAKPTKNRSGNDGNLANNAKPYDKVTQGDVVAGRLGKDEMGGKSKPSKPKVKKEKEVEESTTSGSVATASTSGKASKGGMSFGKGIYDSIDRAVERQITESMNISMSMNNEGGGAGQTLTITATDEDASQLAQLLKMAGMGVSTADGDYTALMPHSGEEVCAGCGMADCGCGDMEQMDETYGDNVVSMNSPNYPTNTERAQNNFGYSGGPNKPKHDVAGNGQSTVPVTAVRNQDSEFLESIQRIREIAGLKPVSEDKAKWLKPEGMPGSEPTAPGGVEKKKEGDVWVYTPKVKDERLTTTIPSKYVNLDKKDQKYIDPDKRDSENKDSENKDSKNSTNESIFTDTANLWKRYKG